MCLKISGCLWPSSGCDRIFPTSPYCHSTCTFGGWIIWSCFYPNKSKFSIMYWELFTVILSYVSKTSGIHLFFRTTWWCVKIFRAIMWALSSFWLAWWTWLSSKIWFKCFFGVPGDLQCCFYNTCCYQVSFCLSNLLCYKIHRIIILRRGCLIKPQDDESVNQLFCPFPHHPVYF